MNSHTVELLKVCDSGTKTAVNSIKEVMDNINSQSLRELLTNSLSYHEELGNEIHEMLSESGEEGKEPNPMAKMMSWLKINIKMLEKPEDKNIAHLMFDGCSMGVKQLSEYLNKYSQADDKSQRLAKKLIDCEEKLASQLKEYL